MDAEQLLDNIHDLSDIELGCLLSLIAQGHCLMTIEDTLIDDLTNELSLIVSERFGLTYAVLGPDDYESPARFGEAILEETGTQFSTADDSQPGSLRMRLASLDIRAAPRSQDKKTGLDNRMIKNVVIAKDFNFANQYVQVQALEIINNHRFISHTTVHTTQKVFLFVPIIAASTSRVQLIPHLNDRIFISHHHLPEFGFAYLEELEDSASSRHSSEFSRLGSARDLRKTNLKIGRECVDKIRAMGDAAAVTPEIRRYLQDIATFLRLERGVDGGVTPRASTQFLAMAKYLAPLHGIDFVTPSLVALAARKVYTHRIVMASTIRDRSMQYGSEPEAVTELLQELTPQEIIENVLNAVPNPI